MIKIRKAPTKNSQAPKVRTNQFSSLKLNIEAAKIRHETLAGREYLVAPAIMITEGVHNGSAGPLFYPREELQKNPESWNHMPIVVYHPERNGEGVSARDPDVLNSRGVGILLNTQYDLNGGEPGKPRLKTEAWLDKDRLESIDSRVLEAINNGQMVEVSTGLFTDNEVAEKDSVWNGENYSATARNYRPDHLAILPDQKGSCSIADGAGLLRNGEKISNKWSDAARAAALEARRAKMKGGGGSKAKKAHVYSGAESRALLGTTPAMGKSYGGAKEYHALKKARHHLGIEYSSSHDRAGTGKTAHGQWHYDAEHGDHVFHPTIKKNAEKNTSDMTYDHRHMLVADAMRKRSGTTYGAYPEALTDDRVFYRNDQGDTVHEGYELNDEGTKASLLGDPQKVLRKTQYVDPDSGEPIANSGEEDEAEQGDGGLELNHSFEEMVNVIKQANQSKPKGSPLKKGAHNRKGNTMNVKEVVDALIKNGDPWSEADRSFLESLTPARLAKFASNGEVAEEVTTHAAKKKAAAKPPADSEEEDEEESDDSMTKNSAAGPVTLDQYITNAPPAIREVLSHGIRAHNEQKGRLIKTITSNSRNRFTPEALKTKSLDELQSLAALAAPEDKKPAVANFEGLGLEAFEPITNASVPEALPIPTMDFSK